MTEEYRAPDGHCSHPGCPATYRDHRWGKSAAQDEGWFFQRSGETWCPEHVPGWVEEWRASSSLARVRFPPEHPQ